MLGFFCAKCTNFRGGVILFDNCHDFVYNNGNMNIKIGKSIKFLIICFIMLLGACFSGGIIFSAGKTTASGGIYVEDGANVNISGGILQDNNQAIVIEGGEYTISNVRISGSTNGAVIIAAGSSVTIENSIIEGNTNTGNGGAIYVGEGATLNIINTKISNNTTTANGGAIYACANSVVQISGTTSITGNSGNFGGGIYLEEGALLNNGTAGIEYFAGNTSVVDQNVWQNVHYESVDAKIVKEGLLDDSLYESFYAEKMSSNNSIEIEALGELDYYTWLPYEKAPSSEILTSDDVVNKKINTMQHYEGKSSILLYGENKITYSAVSGGLEAKATRKEISGLVKIQETYNGLSVIQIAKQGFYYISTINGSLIIPANVETIGEEAFTRCANLEEIVFAEGSKLKSIDYFAFGRCTKINSVNLPESKNDVTISSFAFAYCDSVKNINVPQCVVSIGGYAFYDCINVESIYYNADLAVNKYTSDPAVFSHARAVSPMTILKINTEGRDNFNVPSYLFYTAQNIKELNITKADNIGGFAFAGCTGVEKVTAKIDNSIGEYAFYNTKLLSELNLDKTSQLKDIGYRAFEKCVSLREIKLPSFVTRIQHDAFYGCTSATALELSDCLTTIDYNAFAGCTSLTGTLNLPNTLVTIGNSAFNNCYMLKNELIIPEKVTQIGSNAFWNCSRITRIDIPQSVTWMGEKAFFQCIRVAEINYNGSVPLAGYGSDDPSKQNFNARYLVFSRNEGMGVETTLNISSPIVANHIFREAYGITTVNIGENVEKIGAKAFYACRDITSVNFEEGNLSSIGKYAFGNCTSLISVNIPTTTYNSGITINEYAFNNCTSVANIKISDSVTYIGGSAFYNCENARLIQYYGNIPQTAYTATNLNIFGIQEGVVRSATLELYSEIVPNNMFYNVRGINDVSIFGENVVIGDHAFYSSEITKITSIATIEKIETSAFAYCTKLTTANFANGLKTIGVDGFEACYGLTSITLPADLEKIDSYGFNLCKALNKVILLNEDNWFNVELGNQHSNPLYEYNEANLNNSNKGYFYYIENGNEKPWKDVEVPTYVTEIKNFVFINSAITSFTFNGTETYIGKYFIYQNYGIESITIPNSVETIGDRAFQWCKSLNTINVPSSLSRLGQYVFDGCSGVTSVTGGSDLYRVEGNAIITNAEDNFGSVIRRENTLIFGCQTTIIPESVWYIGDRAFYGQTKLTSIVIPDNVIEIEVEAFRKCSSLASVSMGAGVQKIGPIVFEKCPALKSITFDNAYNWFVLDSDGNIDSDRIALTNATTNATTFKAESGDYYEKDWINKSFTATMVDDVYVVSAGNGSATTGEIVIPATYKGVPITKFANNAYKNSSISNIIFTENITAIGSGAFENCKNITEFVIGESINIIGGRAFYGCDNLATITYNGSIAVDLYGYFNQDLGDDYSEKIESAYNVISNPIFGSSTTNLIAETKLIINSAIVPNYLFYGAKYINEVEIGDNVTLVGSKAFMASSITKVTTSEQSNITDFMDRAFSHCRYLTEFNINGGLEKIHYSVFDTCDKLQTMTVSENLEEIHSYAFRLCNELNKVILTDDEMWFGVTLSGEQSNPLYEYNEANLNNSNKGYFYIDGSPWLDVEVPSGVTEINDYSFINSAITSFTFNGTETYIGKYFIYQNYGIESITIPNSVETIGDRAFQWDEKLTTINVPTSLSRLGQYVFDGCANVTSVTGGSDLYRVEGNAIITNAEDNFDSIIRRENTLIFGCQTTIIPESVWYIGDRAFYGQTKLTSIVIPDNVIGIESKAFRRTGLTTFNVGAGVQELGPNIFQECDKLASVTFANNENWYLSDDGINVTSIVAANTTNLLTTYSNKYWINRTFTFEDNGSTYVVSAYNSDITGQITIPSTYLDKPVTSVKNSGFANTVITKVTFRDSIKYIGDSAFYDCSRLIGELDLPSELETIGDKAFWDATHITKITIPASVVAIGYKAFFQCIRVTEINYYGSIPLEYYNNVNTTPLVFSQNDNEAPLKVVNIYSSVVPNYLFRTTYGIKEVNVYANSQQVDTTIGRFAFTCPNLTKVTFDNNIATIGDYAFYSCKALTDLYINGSIGTIKEIAFRDCNALSNIYIDNIFIWFDITFKAQDANPMYAYHEAQLKAGLSGHSQLNVYQDQQYLVWENIVIPSAITVIKDFTFINSGIKSIQFIGNTTTIGQYAFYQNKLLASVVLPDSITTIGNRAFQWDAKLTTINVPTSLSRLGQYVFDGCSGVTSVTGGSDLYRVEGNAIITNAEDNFDSVIRRENTLIFGCQTTTIPTSVWYIGDRAFYSQTNLTSIVIPDNVIEIEVEAFRKCSALESVEIGAGMQKIGPIVFEKCPALTSITFANAYNWFISTDGANVEGSAIALTSASSNANIFTAESGDYYEKYWINKSYALTKDGNYYTVSAGNGTATTGEIVIPDSYKGVGVHYISPNAFSDSDISSIHIKGEVWEIGANALRNCASLQKVVLKEQNWYGSDENHYYLGNDPMNYVSIVSFFKSSQTMTLKPNSYFNFNYNYNTYGWEINAGTSISVYADYNNDIINIPILYVNGLATTVNTFGDFSRLSDTNITVNLDVNIIYIKHRAWVYADHYTNSINIANVESANLNKGWRRMDIGSALIRPVDWITADFDESLTNVYIEYGSI